MKKLLCFLLFLFPFTIGAQEKENLSQFSQEELRLIRECCLAKQLDSPSPRSREEKRILENCCLVKKEKSPQLFFGNLKTSRELFLAEMIKKRKLQLFATKTNNHREGWSLRTKRQDNGYHLAVTWESNRDPVKFLFEPFFNIKPDPHK